MDLGDRMKRYERVSDSKLTRRMPVIGRIDGKAFHTFTKNMEKPFDKRFQSAMLTVAGMVCREIQGCKIAYVQSDEINLLLTDYDELNTDSWFDYRISKMCSVAAGFASAYMTLLYQKLAVFDARFFNIPKEDVCNYFVWRQQDAVKNSINSYAQTMFPQAELQGKHGGQLQEMMFQQHGFNWNEVPVINKRGACAKYYPDPSRAVFDFQAPVEVKFCGGYGWGSDYDIPEFAKDRVYIEKLILTNEEKAAICGREASNVGAT